ncbi:hypothetical protein [Roseisalinus antarcticus]|uniref:Pentapeptide repeats (8 copies) n=1 Tax=Roseisalinus antarcticus TaxID=254357 RepID=A0A1Y5SM60_9RHOB|nr:hypothetical protein [Roseisalinus antarcticus]SLN43574.1 hypothetical protein ROA7023_01783 [Roseisalinus antarcticus]
MTAPPLTEDCASCAALCCVGLAFDRGAAFALDKPADTPCPHLTGAGLCGIHGNRDAHGFSGCTRYTCNGAGQYVTKRMFDGASWQRDPSILAPMTAAFRDLAQVQQLRVLLQAAESLPLPDDARSELARFQTALIPAEGAVWTPEALERLLSGPVPGDIRRFLKGLKAYVPAPSARRPPPMRSEPAGGTPACSRRRRG